MSDEAPTSWFHCAHCGTLFRAGVGRAPTCTSCGKNPSLGVKAVEEPQLLAELPKAKSRRRHSKEDAGSQRTRRAKSGAPMLLLVAGWSVVMLAIVLAASRCWKPVTSSEVARQPDDAPAQLNAEELELIRKHGTTCQQIFGRVLSNSSPEGLGPYVLNRSKTFSDMVRFYRMNSGATMQRTRVELTAMSVIRLPDGPAIEGRWKTDDGQLIDAVFRQEDDTWLIDWHHYVRYSDHPWSLFLAGDGPEVAEFRLLARQRLTRRVLDAEDDDGGNPLSLVFYAPRFGRPDNPGPSSPVFDLDRDGEAAQLLAAGFAQSAQGRRPFRALLPSVEPDEEMMRVRVVVRRIDEEDERRFEIVEVRACHWHELGDPGVDPQELDDADPQ